MHEDTELLREMRDLLRLIAEPMIAKRDEALRAKLRIAAGRSAARTKAVLLMDGTRSQTQISKESGLDKSDLSKLVKLLRRENLLRANNGNPKLAITVLPSFFSHTEDT